MKKLKWIPLAFFLAFTGCSTGENQQTNNTGLSAVKPDSDNGGLILPDGFQALVVIH